MMQTPDSCVNTQAPGRGMASCCTAERAFQTLFGSLGLAVRLWMVARGQTCRGALQNNCQIREVKRAP